MKFNLLSFFILLFSIQIFAQQSIETLSQIQIARDAWGVPHIYAPTDREVAFGLAWAQCEDDFNTLQEQMLAIRGKYGEVKGKSGAILDFGIKFMCLREVVEERYHSDLSPEFREILDWYTDGVNSYAALHPKEVLNKKLFPVRGQDVIIGYLLGLVELSHARSDLMKILEGKTESGAPRGSNAIAVSRKKTTDGKTYLAINSHQPLEGWYSWYEAHLISDEGWNILGGTFPGGVSIFHGVNENLGWAHTVNHPDFSDIYKLEMHPTMKNHYRFDGEWFELKKKKYKGKVKLSFLKIPVSQKVFESKYGITFKTDDGYFAWRYSANQDIRAAEQWYRMNKAQNFEEFRELLSWRAVSALNVVYADREDNIFYVSGGKVPARNPNFDWSKVLPGDTSATLWTDYVPFENLPQVLNPESGYVFNMNNTPFSSSALSDNPVETDLNKTMGYQPTGMESNRSTRFMEMIGDYEKLSWEVFKKIKYDEQYPTRLGNRNMTNLEIIMHLDSEEFLHLKDAVDLLKNWDRRTNVENTKAAFAILTIRHLVDNLKKENRYVKGGKITPRDCFKAIEKAQTEMLEKHGKLEVPLGDIQRHVRGNVSLPCGGGPDVLRAEYGVPDGDGKTTKLVAGESYIEMVRFGSEGVEIETVNAYGASAKPDSPHYTDQMEMYANKGLKKMSLDWEKVKKEAVNVYSPKRVR